MLHLLSKRDKYWRGIAFNICKDKQLADDLVQTMYLKLSDYNIEKFKKYKEHQQQKFIYNSIKFIYLDLKKKKEDARLEELYYVQDQTNTFEPDDLEQSYLEEFDKLNWVQQELLLESLDRSLRDIQKMFNINYGYTYRQVKEAKKTIRDK